MNTPFWAKITVAITFGLIAVLWVSFSAFSFVFVAVVLWTLGVFADMDRQEKAGIMIQMTQDEEGVSNVAEARCECAGGGDVVIRNGAVLWRCDRCKVERPLEGVLKHNEE